MSMLDTLSLSGGSYFLVDALFHCLLIVLWILCLTGFYLLAEGMVVAVTGGAPAVLVAMVVAMVVDVEAAVEEDVGAAVEEVDDSFIAHSKEETNT